MPVVSMHGVATVGISDLKMATLSKRDTPFRKLCEVAVGRALYLAGFGVLGQHIVGGIVGVADWGDRYPEHVRELERMRPSEFGSSVLNSAIGHCALVFNLRGPQIQTVHGDDARLQIGTRPTQGTVAFMKALRIGHQQIRWERAQLMAILNWDDDRREAGAVIISESELSRARGAL